jgi:hypothetical protein
MIIGKEQSYKLVGFEGGFAIVPSGTKVNMPKAQEMILADRNALCEYLATYLSLREEGKPNRECHEIAMRACKIQKVIKLS